MSLRTRGPGREQPRQTRPRRHGGRLPPPVLDLPGPDHPRPDALARGWAWSRAREDDRSDQPEPHQFGRIHAHRGVQAGRTRPRPAGGGGSVNGQGAITVQIAKTGKDTYLSQVINMVGQAQASRSRTQDLANRAALWLTFIALGAGLVTLSGWLLNDRGFAFAIERMVTVMVIACPRALELTVPLGSGCEHNARGEERLVDPRPRRVRARPRAASSRVRQDRYADGWPFRRNRRGTARRRR
jgi:E1-E2 ATPase